jgi:organic hydroperoxide reductase OsmC/OhrA
MARSVAEPGEEATVTIDLEAGYRFRVDLGEPFPPLFMDEPPPLGEGRGPNASRLLAAAVGNCLAASLLFCLRKARIEVASLRTTVRAETGRNERGRLRVTRLTVQLEPRLTDPQADPSRISRCLAIFEDFCVVTESVRAGLEVDVRVDVVEGRGKGAAAAAPS